MRRNLFRILAAGFFFFGLVSGLCAEDRLILSTGSYYRAFAMWTETGAEAFAKLKTAPPPSNWNAADFNDQDWPRSSGPFPGNSYYLNNFEKKPKMAHGGLLCLRGRFLVKDTAGATDLSLSLKYRGGIIAYLNGKEIARAHLPKEVLPETTGEAYAAGEDTAAKLERSLGPVTVPATLLQKGTNVLALELHGSAYAADSKTEEAMVGLYGIALSCGFAGIEPNLDRPAGFQLFNMNPNHVFLATEYGDPTEPLRPLRFCGARNAAYSGVVVAASTSPLVGLKAVPSDLVQVGGAGKIQATFVEVRYQTLSNRWGGINKRGLSKRTYEWVLPESFAGMESEAPENIPVGGPEPEPSDRTAMGLPPKPTPAALCPVWVTINVPKDLAPGKYAGTLTLSAKEIPKAVVPLEIEVVAWTVPDDKKTGVAIYESPETLADYYKVEKWSDAHWALIEKSYELTGRTYNQFLSIPLLEKSQNGNQESLVVWKKQADGSFQYDFEKFDKLLSLATKYCRLKFVSCDLTHGCSEGEWGTPQNKNPNETGQAFVGSRAVTVLDEAGKPSTFKLPDFGTPESEKPLKALTDALLERLKKYKLENAFVLGVAQDTGLKSDLIESFKKLQPNARWHYAAHSRLDKGPYTLVEYLYVANWLPAPGAKKNPFFQDKTILMSQRMGISDQPCLVFRTMTERAILLGDQGAGRMGIDFWDMKASGWWSTYFSRWPNSSAGQRSPCLGGIALPGKKAPVTTPRIEALREGVQETEARIFIQEAIEAKKISGQLAEKAQKLLEARHQYCRLLHANKVELRVAIDDGDYARSLKLYQLAAEVAAAMGQK